MKKETLYQPSDSDWLDYPLEPSDSEGWDDDTQGEAAPEQFESPKRQGLIKRFGEKITRKLGSGPAVMETPDYFSGEERARLNRIAEAQKEFTDAESEARKVYPDVFAELDAMDEEMRKEQEYISTLHRDPFDPRKATQRADKYNMLRDNLSKTPWGEKWDSARTALNEANSSDTAEPQSIESEDSGGW